MRELLLKNLTSADKKRRIIASSEIADNQGVRSIIQRHFVYIAKEIKDKWIEKPMPYLYVLREHNNKCQTEKFFCRLKGSVYVVSNGRLFLIFFMHSLKITLVAVHQQNLMGYNKA